MRIASQIMAEERRARRKVHRMAREVSGFVKNPVGAFEEFGAPQVLLALLGLGVVGGGIYYVATKKPAAAAGPGAQTAANSPLQNPSGFNMATLRRSLPAIASQIEGTNVQVPAGTGSTIRLKLGEYLTLSLPPGAKWAQVLIGNSTTNASSAVPFAGDLTDSISIPIAAMVAAGTNAVVASFVDATGKAQGGMYGMQVTV